MGTSRRLRSPDDSLPTAFLDHAKTLEFKFIKDPEYPSYILGVSLRFLAHLFEIPSLEKLTVHDIYEGEPAGTHSAFAPSLTHLDLRWYEEGREGFMELDAPKLSQLSIDYRFMDWLTPASTFMLSSLTLRIVEADWTAVPEAVDRLWDLQGSLKLYASGSLGVAQLLSLLEVDFRWPGLEEIEVELVEDMIGALISIFIARTAGARGASMGHFLKLLREAEWRIAGRQGWLGESGPALVPHVQDLMAIASAFQLGASTRSLCAQVHWRMILPTNKHVRVPGGILDWLEAQPNVVLIA